MLLHELVDRGVDLLEGFRIAFFHCLYNAVIEVLPEDQLAGIGQFGANGCQLDQHIRTILAIRYHALYGFQVSRAARQTVHDRPNLLRVVRVRMLMSVGMIVRMRLIVRVRVTFLMVMAMCMHARIFVVMVVCMRIFMVMVMRVHVVALMCMRVFMLLCIFLNCTVLLNLFCHKSSIPVFCILLFIFL